MEKNDATKDELLQLERRYWQAIKDRDYEAANELTDDPCVVAGASGVATIDKAQFKKIMDHATYRLKNVSISDEQVRMLGDDVAIVAYKVHEELLVDDKPVTMEAADSSVWTRRNNKWVCSMHTESLVGDPYGRDRSPGKPQPAAANQR